MLEERQAAEQRRELEAAVEPLALADKGKPSPEAKVTELEDDADGLRKMAVTSKF